MAITKDDDLRFGTSALHMDKKEYALNDEMLLDGTTGKIYYKRLTDGQIVSSDSLNYEKSTLSTALRPIMGVSSFKSDPTDFVMYYTANITEKSELLNSTAVDVGLSTHRFNVSAKESGFFIRVRGTDSTNSIVSFLETIYEDTAIKNAVSVIVSITEHGKNDFSHRVSVSCKYNELTLVEITPTDATNATNFDVVIESVAYPWLRNAYQTLTTEQKADIEKMNHGNKKLESDTIDIITFSSNVEASALYSSESRIQLNMVIPVETMAASFTGGSAYNDDTSLVVSREEPDHPCVWRKIMD